MRKYKATVKDENGELHVFEIEADCLFSAVKRARRFAVSWNDKSIKIKEVKK